MLNDASTPLSLLETRRSGKPRDLVAPGPDAQALRRMVTIAARTPDHGKLVPWRFVIVPRKSRPTLAAVLEAALREKEAAPLRGEIEAARRFATQAPALVVVVSSPKESLKIPAWEQQLSSGAAAMNLLHAAHASGFAGGWVTGWMAYSDAVARGLGLGAEERIAGFVFIGTPVLPLEERARPMLADVLTRWAG